MNICDQFRDIYESYALGALDATERASLEAHLATGCVNCSKAIEEARWLISKLAYVAAQTEPSGLLKGRLLKTVRAEATAPARLARPKGVVPIWLWAGLAALLLLTAYSEWNSAQLRNEIRRANERTSMLVQQRHDLEAQLELAKHEARILTDPASVKVVLASTNPQMPHLEAMWHSQMGIVVMGQHVPLPAGNRVLQLWLIPKAQGSKPMPSLTMRPEADGKLVFLVANPPELMTETKALAITEEPEGGSPQPTSAPAWVGGLS